MADLKALLAATNDACDAAHKQSFRNACINWGDLGCVRAFEWIDDEGDKGYRVLIEEASPDNGEFCAFVRDYLNELGWLDVQVDCEW